MNSQYFRLKYFYNINPDEIAHQLKSIPQINDLSASSISDPRIIDNALLLIFKTILGVMEPYASFILSENYVSHPSFFNEIYFPRTPSNLNIATESLKPSPDPSHSFSLAGISLFHHCIVRSLLQSLIPEGLLSLTDEKQTYVLCGPNDSIIKNGYFFNKENDVQEVVSSNKKMITKEDFAPEDQDDCDNISGRYSTRYKRFHEAENRYSKKILLEHSQLKRYPQHNPRLLVPKMFSNPCYFLFWSNRSNTFNKALLPTKTPTKPNDLIDKYDAFRKEALNWTTELNTDIDCLLYDSFLEPYYGFQLFPYLQFQIYQLYETDNPLKSLCGNTLLNLITNHIHRLPLTYNKGIFLKYAFDAISCATTLQTTFPKKPNYVLAYDEEKNLSTDRFSISALSLLGQYLRALELIVVPLLNDLWDTLISILDIHPEYIQTFFINHFHTITFDYTQIPSTEVKRSPVHARNFITEYKLVEKAICALRGSESDTPDIPITFLSKVPLSQIIQGICTFRPVNQFQNVPDHLLNQNSGLSLAKKQSYTYEQVQSLLALIQDFQMD